MPDPQDEIIHLPETREETDERIPGLGEQAILPGGGITEGDAVPEMPPGSDMEDQRGTAGYNSAAPGGGLDATDMAEPTSTADTTGDRATGLTGMRGG